MTLTLDLDEPLEFMGAIFHVPEAVFGDYAKLAGAFQDLFIDLFWESRFGLGQARFNHAGFDSAGTQVEVAFELPVVDTYWDAERVYNESLLLDGVLLPFESELKYVADLQLDDAPPTNIIEQYIFLEYLRMNGGTSFLKNNGINKWFLTSISDFDCSAFDAGLDRAPLLIGPQVLPQATFFREYFENHSISDTIAKLPLLDIKNEFLSVAPVIDTERFFTLVESIEFDPDYSQNVPRPKFLAQCRRFYDESTFDACIRSPNLFMEVIAIPVRFGEIIVNMAMNGKVDLLPNRTVIVDAVLEAQRGMETDISFDAYMAILGLLDLLPKKKFIVSMGPQVWGIFHHLDDDVKFIQGTIHHYQRIEPDDIKDVVTQMEPEELNLKGVIERLVDHFVTYVGDDREFEHRLGFLLDNLDELREYATMISANDDDFRELMEVAFSDFND